MHYNSEAYPQNVVYDIFGKDYKNVDERIFGICEKFIDDLPKEDKLLVEDRYKNQKTYGDIATQKGVSREMIRQKSESIKRRLTYVIFENAVAEIKNADKKESYTAGYVDGIKDAVLSDSASKIKQPIEMLGLSVRSTNALHRLGCTYVADVVKKSKDEIRSARSIGAKSSREIFAKMKEIGYPI